MVITVFRSRLKPDSVEAYTEWAARMDALAKSMPGYLSHKVFIAEDGERVTLVEFESEQAHKAWSVHPEHLKAQGKGRESFYAEYRLQVCNVIRETRFVAE